MFLIYAYVNIGPQQKFSAEMITHKFSEIWSVVFFFFITLFKYTECIECKSAFSEVMII